MILAPSERAVVDVLFDSRRGHTRAPHAGEGLLAWCKSWSARSARRRSPATATDSADVCGPNARHGGRSASRSPRYLERRARTTEYSAFVVEMDMRWPEGRQSSTRARCTPKSSDAQPGSCPECGDEADPVAAPETYICPMHPEVEQGSREVPGMRHEAACRRRWSEAVGGHGHGQDDHDHHDEHGHAGTTAMTTASRAGGIEWEDDMVEVNRGQRLRTRAGS